MTSSLSRALNRSGSIKSSNAEHNSSFCTNENFLQSLTFLDQELSVYGYPSIQSNGLLNKVTILNVMYDLLTNYRKSLEAHSETTDDLRNTENDAARSQHLLSLAKEDAANKDRELKSKCIEEAHLQQRIESLRKKYKSEQEKCRKMSADIASRDCQYKHEKKKKIQEIEKLQSKLHQLLQDKRHERLLGIELLNSLQRTDGKRGKWNTDKNKKNNEQEMYRLIITNYEDSQRQLLSENADMRKYLKQMQDELIAALNEKVIQSDSRRSSVGTPTKDCSRRDSLDSAKTSNSEDSEISITMSEGVFEMPYNLVKEDIEKSLKSKWKALRKMHKQRSKSDDTKKNETFVVESSQTKREFEKVIKEQQKLIDYLTSCQDCQKSGVPNDSYFLEEKEELDKAKSRFYHQRLAFEKERKIYTEALLQLGQDRQDFEEEKGKWLQNKFLQLTPFRESPSRNSSKLNRSANSSSARKGLSASWNEGVKANGQNRSLRSSRGEADGMGHSGGFTGASPALVDKSANLGQFYASPEQINPWTKDSPPVPSTCELYRALGLRYQGKENQESISDRKLTLCLPSVRATPSAWSELRFPQNLLPSQMDCHSSYFNRANARSCSDLSRAPGCTNNVPGCKSFSRTVSLDSLLSYHTTKSGRSPEGIDGGDGLNDFASARALNR